MRRATWILTALMFAALILAPGCHLQSSRVVPFDPPLSKPLAPADDPCGNPSVPPTVAMATPAGGVGPFDMAAGEDCPMRPPRNVLALSGRGASAAYSTDFIDS